MRSQVEIIVAMLYTLLILILFGVTLGCKVYNSLPATLVGIITGCMDLYLICSAPKVLGQIE